jgi:DNA-binding transcriptional LysR family regulator
VDLRRLRYFLAVARERNFTRAAEQLHVAQPALSRQVKLLEQELGVELLHRTTHEFELTEAGAFLFERGTALTAAADELSESVRRFGRGEQGTVSVAYGASSSYETAPRLLEALARREPDIALSTTVASTGDIVAGVSAGTIDLGLVRCPERSDELELTPIRSERQGVLLRDDHRLAGRADVSLPEVAGEFLLMHAREANPGHYDALLDLCRDGGLAEPKIVLRTLSFDLAYTPVARGEAIAIVAESSTHGLPGDLRWLPLSPPAHLDVALIAAACGERAPSVERTRAAALEIAEEFGWRRS